MKICSFGEILFDIIKNEAFLGGAPLNFAGNLSRLGAEVLMVSRLGADSLGKRAFASIGDMGISTRFLQNDPERPTGTVRVILENGEPHYAIADDVAYDRISAQEARMVVKENCDLLYFGTLAQRSPDSRQALETIFASGQFKHRFYDINLRPGNINNEVIRSSLNHCTILKLNESEFDYLSREFLISDNEPLAHCRQLSEEYDINLILITAGGRGCHVFHQNELHFVPGKEVGMVDAVGAGDAFSAAFVYSLLKNNDPIRAAAAGNLLGAFVAGSRGALPQLPQKVLAEIIELER